MSKYIIALFVILTTVNPAKASDKSEEPVSPAAQAIVKRFGIDTKTAAHLAERHGISTPEDLKNIRAVERINRTVRDIRRGKASKGGKK